MIDGGAPARSTAWAVRQARPAGPQPVALAPTCATRGSPYTGNGQAGHSTPKRPVDIQEPIVRDNNWVLHNRLNGLGISHTRRLRQRHALVALLAALAGHRAPGPARGPLGDATGRELVADGGFEWGGLGAWRCVGSCSIDNGLGLARTGGGNGWVRNTSGWNDVHQTVSVTPNTPYRLTAWVRTGAANVDIGFLGLRTTSGTVIGERSFARLDGYTR